MYKILDSDFFKGPSEKVAPKLLGKFLVRKYKNQTRAFIINEIEAYGGKEDLASHARFGKTKRNLLMWGKAGVFYVYFIYGMYWMLNIICGEVGKPSAILIRGVSGLSGPGVLTRELKIDGSFSGLEASIENKLWFEDRGVVVKNKDLIRTKRVGVDYSGVWKNKLWNFKLKS